ncbi:hypothetical protein K0T92_10380 [Paenibacillus oenotherae]|uniref:Uncharacterized protein n=1 Tax=Paenibacillus oenotherae TaxID=1435645 RepID=A0ABS7D5F2_9BACL|nr:hypothetical protein [Paenibacillus oenotherae]MBW7475154.1 hypothetical protein [Paenibacillus oenotherae]
MEKPLVVLARLVTEVSEVIARETIPEEARGHFRAAAREALLGGRAMLGSLIDSLEADSGTGNTGSGSKPAARSARPIAIE